MKRCIFHYLHPIEDKPNVGSALRPNQMLQAFRDIGYEVDTVIGYSTQRKKQIRKIKQNIKNGVCYDFVYSESVNDPTLLSDADHFPRHPFLDFSFLRFCRKQGIPVGLFYRDVYWKFPIFREGTSLLKRMILKPMFAYDLLKYPKCLDLMFLPTMRMQQYALPGFPSRALPPGGVLRPESYEKRRAATRESGRLHIFYVGSLSALYDNRLLFQAVQETPGAYLTVCTHQKQWESVRPLYEPYLCDRIEVVHKSGDALREYYEAADVAAYCLNHDEYLDMAMPIKVFESISYGTPLLVTSIFSIAQLVQSEDIGWVVETSVQGIRQMLTHLMSHPEEVRQKTEHTILAAQSNTWQCRALQAAKGLTELKKKEKQT